MALSGHIRVMKTAQYLILNPHPNPLPGLGEGIIMVMTGLGGWYLVIFRLNGRYSSRCFAYSYAPSTLDSA